MEKENSKIANPLYELILGDNEIVGGVSAISFVDHPAHESDFMFFSKVKKESAYKFASTDDKFMVTGPALIPNQKIFRLDKDGNAFDVFFSEDTIIKCNELYFKRSQHTESNVQHSNDIIEGVTVVESWIIEDPDNDKSNVLGFTDLPKGTWMVSYKVDDEDLWSQIKDGEVKGFSIEGYFITDLIEMSKTEETKEIDISEIAADEESYNKIAEIIADKSLNDEQAYDKISEILK